MTKYTHDQRMQVLSVCSDYLEGKLSFNSAENKIRSLVPSYPVRNLRQQISSLEKCLSGIGSYGFAYPATWAKALIELFDKNPKVIAALNEQQELYYARDGKINGALDKILKPLKKPTEKELELMQNFDPQIIETIADVLKNSKDLLGIEEWQNFELDFSTPVEEKNEIFQKIKNNINDFKNVVGIYAIFDSDKCLYIGKGKPIWGRIKSHYKAAKGLDKAIKWAEFFKQYQKNLKIFWIEYNNLNDPTLDDKLRELFEHILKIKYNPIFDID